MTNIEYQIAEWHERNFGVVDVPATYRKLLEEVGELGEAIIRGDESAMQEEAGDVAFVLSHIIRVAYPHNPSINYVLAVTLDKVESKRHRAKRLARARKGTER